MVKKLILVILFCCSCYGQSSYLPHRRLHFQPLVSTSSTAVDMFWDGEGTVGVTNSLVLLSNQTHELVPNGAWVFNPAGVGTNMDYIAAGQLETSLFYPISVGGTPYTGAGSTGFRLSIATVATIECRKTILATNIVVVGFDIQCSPEADFASIDLAELRGQNGTVHATVQWRSNPSTYMVMHTDDGASVSSEQIPSTNSCKYRVQMRADTIAKLGSMAVFNITNNYTRIGISTLAMGSNPVNLVIAPQVGAHGNTSPTSPYFYFDNFVFFYGTNAPSITNLF